MKNKLEMKRLFTAIPVTGEAALHCLDIQNRLKSVTGDSIRYTGRNYLDINHKFHLTLEFFGDTPLQNIDSIIKKMEMALLASKPFVINCGKCGFFGSPRSNGSVYVSVTDESGGLDNLYKCLEVSSDVPFHPHITIGRRKELTAQQVKHLITISEEEISGPAMNVEEIVLFSSELTAAGPVYTALRRVSMGNK